MRLSTVVAVLACVLLTACERQVHIRGRITPAVLAFVERQNPGRLFLQGIGGGDEATSLELAFTVFEHDMAVTVSGACASTCAQLVFIAGGPRNVRPGSLLLFSTTATAFRALVATDADPRVVHLYDNSALAELRLYERRHIDPRLLLWPLYRMDVSCYRVIVDQQGRPIDIQWSAQRLGWAAPAGVLHDAGVEFEGFLPETEAVLRASLAPNAVRTPTTAFWFEVEPPDLSFFDLQHAIAGKPRCTANAPQTL